MIIEKNKLNEKINKKILKILKLLYNIFNSHNYELFLVGGCVRDMLLDKEPKDYDLCTSATPEEMLKLFPKDEWTVLDIGIKHGTITVKNKSLNSEFFEITTYRTEGSYSDRRHPDSVSFVRDLESDLARRDFTINSFAYDFITQDIYMLDESFLDDLRYNTLRTVGSPVERFSEDALRMLRAIRFSARYGLNIDPETFNAIEQCGPLLEKISKERIRDELTKIIMSDNPRLLELLACCDIERYLFNGFTPIKNMIDCKQKNKWHYTDVFHHTIDVISRVPMVFEVKWAAFFHDMGKPQVEILKEDDSGEFSYHGHAEVSEEMANKLMGLLRFSTSQKKIIRKMIKYHDFELAKCKLNTFKKIYLEIGESFFEDYLKLRIADASAHQLTTETNYYINYTKIYYDRLKTILKEKSAFTLKDLAINGNDLIEIGYKGKEIGEELNKLLDFVLNFPYNNSTEILVQKAQEDKKEI